MRLNARPLPVAENRSWRSSALALRWAKRGIRRIDWELRPCAWGQLTVLWNWRIAALAYKTERGRPEEPLALWFPSFANSGQQAEQSRLARFHHLGTTLEHPPQRQVRTELESHTPRQRAVRREPSSI